MDDRLTRRRAAVCLHGFLRTGLSMGPVRWRLLREGWSDVRTPTLHYAWRPFERVVATAERSVREAADRHGGAPVDLVTHSFGGLVARALLDRQLPIGRIVMLSPPNQGARMAEIVRRTLPVHRWGWDPLAPLLPGAPASLPVPGPAVDVGVLVGGKGTPGGWNPWLGGDNDGVVRVTEAELPGARDFRVVRAVHTLVMARRDVLDLVVRFLREGRFSSGPP